MERMELLHATFSTSLWKFRMPSMHTLSYLPLLQNPSFDRLWELEQSPFFIKYSVPHRACFIAYASILLK